MRIFVSGGCNNGKSYYAQHLAKTQRTDPLYYVATMRPVDLEDDARIERHRQERADWGFTTVEQPADIENILQKCDISGSFLLDSLTALLANEMFLPDGGCNKQAAAKIIAGLSNVINTIENIVIVSDHIYSDAMLYDPLSEKYRKSLAEIDRAAVQLCDAVIEVAFTNLIIHKGGEAFNAIAQKIG